MPEISFVPVVREDIERLRAMAEAIWRVCYPRILSSPQIDYMLGLMYSRPALENDLDQGVVYEWIEVEGREAGYLAFETSLPGRCLRLNKLYILPGEQGRGLGHAALQHVIELARSLKFPAVELNVNKQNDQAIRAYERAGFNRVASVVNDIGSGYFMDDFVMRKDCSEKQS